MTERSVNLSTAWRPFYAWKSAQSLGQWAKSHHFWLLSCIFSCWIIFFILWSTIAVTTTKNDRTLSRTAISYCSKNKNCLKQNGKLQISWHCAFKMCILLQLNYHSLFNSSWKQRVRNEKKAGLASEQEKIVVFVKCKI